MSGYVNFSRLWVIFVDGVPSCPDSPSARPPLPLSSEHRMTSLRSRKTLAVASAVAALAGGIAAAGPAAAAPPSERVFTYHDANGAQVVTLSQMCAYYTSRAVYTNIVATQPIIFNTLASENNLKIVALTDGNDSYTGGSKDEMVLAFGGNDEIATGSGTDYVCGGAGADDISLGSDPDEAFGDGGNDTISGGSDSDRLFGGDGADKLSGGSGDDRIVGNDGVDTLDGGSGDDQLTQ